MESIVRGATHELRAEVEGVDLTGWSEVALVTRNAGRVRRYDAPRATASAEGGGTVVSVRLTEAETLAMREGTCVEVEVVARDGEGADALVLRAGGGELPVVGTLWEGEV